jgi:hypothetical protein
MPDELVGLFNRSAWPAAAAEPAAGPPRQLFGLTSASGCETCGAEAGRLAVGHSGTTHRENGKVLIKQAIAEYCRSVAQCKTNAGAQCRLCRISVRERLEQ